MQPHPPGSFHGYRASRCIMVLEYLHFLHDNWLLRDNKWKLQDQLELAQPHLCQILLVTAVRSPAQVQGAEEMDSTS